MHKYIITLIDGTERIYDKVESLLVSDNCISITRCDHRFISISKRMIVSINEVIYEAVESCTDKTSFFNAE